MHSTIFATPIVNTALGAKVPIVMAVIDYRDKRAGIGPAFERSGDLTADMAAVKLFYKPFTGRNPDQFRQTDRPHQRSPAIG